MHMSAGLLFFAYFRFSLDLLLLLTLSLHRISLYMFVVTSVDVAVAFFVCCYCSIFFFEIYCVLANTHMHIICKCSKLLNNKLCLSVCD